MISLRQRIKDFFLPIVNLVLRPLSLRLMGRGDPNRTFSEFIGHLSRLGVRFETVIDVGVAYGTNALYRQIPSAKFFLIEPVPKMAPVLQAISKSINAEIFSVAAASFDGEIEFNLHDDVSGSSALSQIEGAAYDGRRALVPARRLDTLISPHKLQGPVLLKIDTQGFELEVLRGAIGIIDKIDVVIIECSFHEFRKGAPEVLEVMTEMDRLGFVAYETLEGHYRILDNALAQVDIAFVQRSSVFRADRGMFAKLID